jgi:hypothetical protein
VVVHGGEVKGEVEDVGNATQEQILEMVVS